jgi:hypothetical protein
MLAETFWAAGAVAAGGYLLLFVLARRPVALRPARVGGLLAGLVGLRLVLAVAGVPLQGSPEVIGTAVLGWAAVAPALAPRAWLVRATGEELREQIQTACRGLFLGLEEAQAGRLRLAAPGNPTIGLWRLAARVQLMVLCRAPGPGKIALLCGWLANQYPGPVPRLRIILKGGAS